MKKSKTVLACGSSSEIAVPTLRKLFIEVFAISVYMYKQPTTHCIHSLLERAYANSVVNNDIDRIIDIFGGRNGRDSYFF